MSTTADFDIGLGDLRAAEEVLNAYASLGGGLITDEASLLRGCLYALVAIGRHLYGHPAEEQSSTGN